MFGKINSVKLVESKWLIQVRICAFDGVCLEPRHLLKQCLSILNYTTGDNPQWSLTKIFLQMSPQHGGYFLSPRGSKCICLARLGPKRPLSWTVVPSCISDYIHHNWCDEITYAFPNCSGASIGVWERISNLLYWAYDYLTELVFMLYHVSNPAPMIINP